MDNKEILKKLSTSGNGKAEQIEQITYRKLVVFIVAEKQYAVDSAEVKEVVIISDLYFIPFVPAYVAGLINRHGEPHTVIDLGMILENEKHPGAKVLVMNREDDQIAFLITDIQKIVTISEKEISAIENDGSVYCVSGSFTLDGNEIFILNTREIYDRLDRDIETI